MIYLTVLVSSALMEADGVVVTGLSDVGGLAVESVSVLPIPKNA